MKLLRVLFASAIMLCVSAAAQSQPRYFVDGFHGGVYGHYPLKSYTGFMLGVLRDNPRWSMCLEIEPETWDSVAVAAPLDYAAFRDSVIRSPRVEYTNPSYAQPYCYNISGESIIRQFGYGTRKLEEHFPGISFDTYAVEEPCFTSCLPQILKGFGFKYATLKNPNTCWGGYAAAHEGEIVDWIGPDGTAITAVPRHDFEELGRKDVWTTTANGTSAQYFSAAGERGYNSVVGMCYQDAGWTGGPWMGRPGRTRFGVEYTTWRNYFEKFGEAAAHTPYPFHQEDVRGGLVWGSQVLQRIARSVRRSENAVLTAEKLGVMAFLKDGRRYDTAQIDEAWRTLMLSQHHDSWIVPYNRLKGPYTWADWIIHRWTVSTEVICDSLVNVAVAPSAVATPSAADGPRTVRVFNTLGHSRSGVVSLKGYGLSPAGNVILTDDAGHEIPGYVNAHGNLVFRPEVPAFGYATYSFRPDDAPRHASSLKEENVLDNGIWRIEFNPAEGGTISSIRDIADHGRELILPGAYRFGELKGYFYDEGQFLSSADAPATVEIICDDAFVQTAVIRGHIGEHPFTQTVSLRQGDPLIRCLLWIYWKGHPGIGVYAQDNARANPERAFYDEKGKMNIYFPVALDSPALFKNAPFDVVQSRLDSTRFTNYYDIRHNVILNWVSLESADGRGFSVHSDHTTAYAYTPGAPLALTVQYAGGGLWGRNYVINGPTEMSFALLPHKGGWTEAEKADARWNSPLICVKSSEDCGEESFIDLMDSGYEISAAYLRDEGFLVRIYNATGDDKPCDVRLHPSIRGGKEVNLDMSVVGDAEISESGLMRVRMPRFGFRTYIFNIK